MAAEAVMEIETYTDKNDQLVDILHNQVNDNTCLRISDERFSVDRRETPVYSKLLAISNVYGYMVAGTPKGLSVFMSKDARDELSKGVSKGTNTAVMLMARKEIDLTQHGRITHVGVSADELSVLVATIRGSILVFSAPSLILQGSNVPTKKIDVGEEIRDMSANPRDLPTSVAVVTVAGGLLIVDTATEAQTTIVAAGSTRVTCVCWSPKGKQLVCGDSGGTLTQRTPSDGAVKRTVSAQASDGNIPENAAVLAVHWIDQHTYFGVYGQLPDDVFAAGCGGGGSASEDFEFEDNATAAYVITRTDKKAPLEWIYVEDPCSSMMCPGRYPGFHFARVGAWGESADNVLVMAGAGSDATMTIGEAASEARDDGTADPDSLDWAQWDIDASMAVMPLSAIASDEEDAGDTFPLGVAVDFTGHRDLPPVADDGARVPPVPILWILNTDACLLAYHVSNVYEMRRGGRAAKMESTVKPLPNAAAAAQPAAFASGTAFGSGFGAKKPEAEAPKPQSGAFGALSKPATATAGAFGASSSFAPSFGTSSGFGASSSGFGKSAVTPIVKAPSSFGMAAAKQGFGSGTKFGSGASSFGALAGAAAAASASNAGSKSVFDAPAAGASIFDAPAKGPSIFDAPAKGPSIFDAPAKDASPFGAAKPKAVSFGGSSVFGGAKAEQQQQQQQAGSEPMSNKPGAFGAAAGSAWGSAKAEQKPAATGFG
ncbi:hypothetical protein IWW50_005576, partial [Coemansia erecta]